MDVDPSPSLSNAENMATPPLVPNASTPRLVIHTLTLENFKSYGGVVHVGPFHTSFSSIIGPNGSGKSNVIDAMLFVFGRRAKALRHNKLSELLHNANNPENVHSAAVTVFFKDIIDLGNGNFDTVPNSEFSVCRRAFRNNTSKYYLNDKEVKMSHIVDLLKKKGVDLDNNRFLILQGEVEQIAMMKPKGVNKGDEGLLEYLEDIIGSDRYIEGIEKTASTVEELNEERGHKLNRVKASERERDALEGAKNEAEDYLAKESILVGMKLKSCRADLFEKQKVINEKTELLKTKEEESKAFWKEVEEKKNELKELETVFKDTQKKAEIAVNTMNKAKDDFSVFERKEVKLREDIKAFKARGKKLETTMKNEGKRVSQSRTKAKDFLEEKAEAEKGLKDAENNLTRFQEKLDKVRDGVRKKTAGIRQKLEEKQTELLPFSETVNEARKELEVNQSELKLVSDKLDAPSRRLEEAQNTLQKIEGDSSTAHDSLKTLQEESEQLRNRLEMLTRDRERTRNEMENCSRAVSALRRKVEEARSRKDEVNTRSRLHNGILSASRNGVLHGVVGRLGDLASVEDRYATAVGAAAGSSLDCIVVQTANNAQACIRFLRQERLGRATFVILEKIEYLRNAMEHWASSNSARDGPRLFDFLKINKAEYRTALYYVLRDTLVAENLEQARRMAFKPTRQNRVVSLQGELIESSGAMTGGGRGPSRYRLGAGQSGEPALTPEEFNKLTEEYEIARSDMDSLERKYGPFQQEIRNCQNRIEEVNILVDKARLESDSYASRIVSMRNDTIPKLIAVEKELQRRIQSGECEDIKKKQFLQQTVAENEEKLTQARKACEQIEGEIKALQEKIVAAGGKPLQIAKEEVDNCRMTISELQAVASKASSRASAAEKATLKAEEAVKQAEKEIDMIVKKIEEAKRTKESMEKDAQVVLQNFEETEAIHKQWEEKVTQVHKEYSEVKERQKELRRKELSMTEALDSLRALVENSKYELRTLRKQEKQLCAKAKQVSLASVDTSMTDDVDNGVGEEDGNENEDQGNTEMEIDSEEKGGKAISEDVKVGSELSQHERKELRTEISKLEIELSTLSPNLDAISEYQNKDTEYKQQVTELDSLTKSRDDARRECDNLRKSRLDEFMSGFNIITLKLKELYQMITLGGDAELELVDSLDPFSEGIVFSVRPPKKSWKNISNLSGGEKTLSSLALVFALHHFKPTPLYFLDEIDAALDYKNVSIVANYVKERTKDAQFIIISLRNNMFELADRLVGIYKTHNSTKSVAIDPDAYVLPVLRKESVAL